MNSQLQALERIVNSPATQAMPITKISKRRGRGVLEPKSRRRVRDPSKLLRPWDLCERGRAKIPEAGHAEVVVSLTHESIGGRQIESGGRE